MVNWPLVALILLVIVLIKYVSDCRKTKRASGMSGCPRLSHFENNGATPYCSPTKHACVNCINDDDCPSGLCNPNNNQCVQCTDDNLSKCPPDQQQCSNGTCQQCKTVDGITQGCPNGQLCDNGRCVNCIMDNDCPTSGANGGQGVCSTGVCGECRFGPDGVAIGCPASAPFCGKDGKCRVCQEDNTGCSGSTPFCLTNNERNQCVGCREWSDCGAPAESLCGPHGAFDKESKSCICDPAWANRDPSDKSDPSRPPYCRVCAPGRGPPGDCSKDLHVEGDGSRTVFTVPGGDSDYNFKNYCFFSDTGDEKLNASCKTAFGPLASVYKMPSGRNNDWNPCNDDSDKTCAGANVSRPVCKVPKYYTAHGVNADDSAYTICNVNGPDSNGKRTTAYPPGFEPLAT